MTGAAVASGHDLTVTFRAMATDVTVRVVEPTSSASPAVRRAEDVFHRVERACTRFDLSSPLMVANATPTRWHEVPAECYAAVAEAAQAYAATGGAFDPRVLRALQAYGYDRTLAFEAGDVRVDGTGQPPGAARRPWRPRFDAGRSAVRVGRDPIDLGGIGKGLAVRWAAAELAGAGRASLVEAGGDCYAAGAGPDGDGWHIGVEDPHGGGDPLAVLRVVDAGCATSSTRIRRWQVGGRTVHHLIDPRTGEAGGDGVVAVTVVHPDPAWAEVWSKVAFLAGRGAIRTLTDDRALAALWVGTDGIVGTSRAMKPYVLWEGPRG